MVVLPDPILTMVAQLYPTGEVRQIKHDMTCNSSNFTYMMNVDDAVSRTLEKPNVRSVNDLLDTDNLLTILTMQKLHQLSLPISNYLITNLQIYSLELQPSKNTARRKAREAYFIVSEAELFLLTA